MYSLAFVTIQNGYRESAEALTYNEKENKKRMQSRV